MDKKLTPSPGTDESKVFHYKMKGDYYRYLAEFVATGVAKSKGGEDACVACAEATKIAEKDLVGTHPVRLAMALNSSVFQSEVPMAHTVQKTKEIPQLRCIDKVVESPGVQVLRVQVVTIQGTQTSESLSTAPACQLEQAETVEELAEASKNFSQDKVQQRFWEQTIETPAISLAEKIVEMPVTRTQRRNRL